MLLARCADERAAAPPRCTHGLLPACLRWRRRLLGSSDGAGAAFLLLASAPSAAAAACSSSSAAAAAAACSSAAAAAASAVPAALGLASLSAALWKVRLDRVGSQREVVRAVVQRGDPAQDALRVELRHRHGAGLLPCCLYSVTCIS